MNINIEIQPCSQAAPLLEASAVPRRNVGGLMSASKVLECNRSFRP